MNWSHTAASSNFVTAPLIVNNLVVEADSSGIVHLFDAKTGTETWNANAGAAISAPDESNDTLLTGMAEAQGVLAVPAGNRLTVFGGSGVWFTGAPATNVPTATASTFTFDSDSATPTFACQLDQSAARPCTSPFTLTGLSNGEHSLTVTDPGASTPSATTTFITDAVAPSVSTTSANQFSDAWATTRSWTGVDTGSGIASYDVRYHVASAQSGFGAYQQPAALQNTTSTTTTLRPAPGSTVCFSVRARDHVGNVSNWSPDSCQSVLLDDHSLTATGSWNRPGSAAGYAGATYSRTTVRGATLPLGNVHARRIGLVATVCPTCGRISVSFPGMATTIVNLYSAQTVKQTFYAFAQQATPATGRVTITALDSGKAVLIDALAAWHN